MNDKDGLVMRKAAEIYKALYDRMYDQMSPHYRDKGGVPKSEILSLCRARKEASLVELEEAVPKVDIHACLTRLLLAGHISNEMASMFVTIRRPVDKFKEGELFE